MNLAFVLALTLAAVDRPVIDLSGGRIQPLPLAIAKPLGSQEPGTAVEAVLAAHRVGDDVVRFFTHEPGVFLTRIAWVRESESGKQVMVSDWDGFGVQPLTGASINLLPSWSPDGRMIAFTSFREGGGAHLYTVEVASRQVRSLIGLGDFATGASYSPDGSRLLFSASQNDNTDVYVAQADGSGARRITEARGIDISASWSPDGKRVAFVSERAGTPQIYTMAADGSDVRRITFQGNYNQEPAWSPKGDLIAFSGRDEHRIFDLYTVAVEGGKVTRLTQNQGTNEKPSWAPNGRYLLYSSTRGGKRQLWETQPDGSNQRAVTSERMGASDPAWGPLPASRRLVVGPPALPITSLPDGVRVYIRAAAPRGRAAGPPAAGIPSLRLTVIGGPWPCRVR